MLSAYRLSVVLNHLITPYSNVGATYGNELLQKNFYNNTYIDTRSTEHDRDRPDKNKSGRHK